MSQAIMAQKQKTLAEAAQANPEHRFTNLYSHLHWDYWIRTAMDTVLARPGSTTAGVDGKARDYFKDHYEETIKLLVNGLRRKTYEPQPVRRVYIPKSNGKLRPLGILALRDRFVQEALRAILDPIFETDFCPHSDLVRIVTSTVPHCLPLPCGWFSQPRTTTKAPPLAQHWSQADLPRSGELDKVPKFTYVASA